MNEQAPEKKLKTEKFKKAQQHRQNLIDQKKRKQSKIRAYITLTEGK